MAEEKPKESKRAKFRRLAKSRLEKATKAIKLIGNLASSNYEYTDAEVDKIFAYLRKVVDLAEDAFAEDSNSNGDFRFDDEE